jgi:hypothetical protein
MASKEVLAFLRSEPDVYAVTPGGEWNVRETAAHLICGSRMYTRLLTDQPSPVRAAYDTSVLNAAFFLAMDEDEPGILADLAERAVTSFLDGTVGRNLDDPCLYMGFATTVGIMAAFECFEYLLHGFDMVRAVGREWASSDSAADPTLAVAGPVILSFLDPAKAGDVDASFAIEGGSSRVCGQMRAGIMEPLDGGAETDCSITGSSSQILLWLTERANWKEAGLSASGRRSELAPTLAERLMQFRPGAGLSPSADDAAFGQRSD